MKTHKPTTIYETTSYVTAMSCNPTGDAVASAHLDGTVYVFWFENADRGAHLIIRHSCVPFALAWGTSIVVAGNNNQVVFYDEDGGEEQNFDMSETPDGNCDYFYFHCFLFSVLIIHILNC